MMHCYMSTVYMVIFLHCDITLFDILFQPYKPYILSARQNVTSSLLSVHIRIYLL